MHHAPNTNWPTLEHSSVDSYANLNVEAQKILHNIQKLTSNGSLQGFALENTTQNVAMIDNTYKTPSSFEKTVNCSCGTFYKTLSVCNCHLENTKPPSLINEQNDSLSLSSATILEKKSEQPYSMLWSNTLVTPTKNETNSLKLEKVNLLLAKEQTSGHLQNHTTREHILKIKKNENKLNKPNIKILCQPNIKVSSRSLIDHSLDKTSKLKKAYDTKTLEKQNNGSANNEPNQQITKIKPSTLKNPHISEKLEHTVKKKTIGQKSDEPQINRPSKSLQIKTNDTPPVKIKQRSSGTSLVSTKLTKKHEQKPKTGFLVNKERKNPLLKQDFKLNASNNLIKKANYFSKTEFVQNQQLRRQSTFIKEEGTLLNVPVVNSPPDNHKVVL